MKKTTLPPAPKQKANISSNRKINPEQRLRRRSRSPEKSDVLVSAVISTYLLTHLHHVLQRAEYGAQQQGRKSQAENFAELRKVLCMDARSMKDASARGTQVEDSYQTADQEFESNAA